MYLHNKRLPFRQHLKVALEIPELTDTEEEKVKNQIIRNTSCVEGQVLQLVSPSEDAEFSVDYFNAENVNADLRAFADKIGVSVFKVDCNKFKATKIVTTNGQYISLRNYINNAGEVIEIEGVQDKKPTATMIYKKLISIGEFEESEAYAHFTPEIVFADLEAYAKKAGVSIDELKSSKHHNVAVKCETEGTIQFKTYILRAAKRIGYRGTNIELLNIAAKLLTELKVFAKFDIHGGTSEDFNLEYLTAENVRFDLIAFAKAAKLKVENVNTRSIGHVLVICSNGKRTSYRKYIRWTGKALGFEGDSNGLMGQHMAILYKLRDIAGFKNPTPEVVRYPKMDNHYFVEKNVKKDLLAYAIAMGLEVNKLTRAGLQKKVRCCNGEVVEYMKYLQRAGVALGFANNGTKARKFFEEIIEELKGIAGFEKKDMSEVKFPEMNMQYFVKDNVLKDLQAWADKCGLQPCDITTTKIKATFKCANGETISGVVLLDRVKRLFNVSKSRKKQLAILKIIAGVELKTYKPMNVCYFTKQNIDNDLQAFAVANNRDVGELTINSTYNSAVCCNGETLTIATYAERAAVALEQDNEDEKIHAIRKGVLLLFQQILNY